jgi:hypothetical protein
VLPGKSPPAGDSLQIFAKNSKIPQSNFPFLLKMPDRNIRQDDAPAWSDLRDESFSQPNDLVIPTMSVWSRSSDALMQRFLCLADGSPVWIWQDQHITLEVDDE